jgi:16S rRNA (adenine1518-N6/adenine1519-N6)-dimethyltransferase
MLRNALIGGDLGFGQEAVADALGAAGIDGKRRAETLSVEEFVRLANAFFEQGK